MLSKVLLGFLVPLLALVLLIPLLLLCNKREEGNDENMDDASAGEAFATVFEEIKETVETVNEALKNDETILHPSYNDLFEKNLL